MPSVLGTLLTLLCFRTTSQFVSHVWLIYCLSIVMHCGLHDLFILLFVLKITHAEVEITEATRKTHTVEPILLSQFIGVVPWLIHFETQRQHKFKAHTFFCKDDKSGLSLHTYSSLLFNCNLYLPWPIQDKIEIFW